MKTGTRKLSNEEIQNIVNLYKGGKSALQVERETGRDHSTIIKWLKKLGVPKHPIYRSSKPRKERVCICGCGRVFYKKPSSMQKYYSEECYQNDHAKKYIAKENPHCSNCKKEIPKECAILNNGKCFMCWFKGRRITKSPTSKNY